jgi:hypothetical protein
LGELFTNPSGHPAVEAKKAEFQKLISSPFVSRKLSAGKNNVSGIITIFTFFKNLRFPSQPKYLQHQQSNFSCLSQPKEPKNLKKGIFFVGTLLHVPTKYLQPMQTM